MAFHLRKFTAKALLVAAWASVFTVGLILLALFLFFKIYPAPLQFLSFAFSLITAWIAYCWGKPNLKRVALMSAMTAGTALGLLSSEFFQHFPEVLLISAVCAIISWGVVWYWEAK